MRPIRIGLTGPLGAGKSLAAAIWESLGAGVVEGDEVGRWALERDAGLRQALTARFGVEILEPSGQIDRRALAQAAFATDEAQQDLTNLTFPILYCLAQNEMERLAQTCMVVVFDAALIYEWGIEKDFDRIVVVTAPPKKLITRAAARMRVSLDEAKARLKRQMAPEEKARRADFVIVNDGSEESFEEAAKEVWAKIVRA